MKTITASSGETILVDDVQYHHLNNFRWYILKNKHVKYAARKHSKKHVLMHRMIMGADANQIVDHINGDGLDNTLSNLRVCTQAENCANRRKRTNFSSKFKGVSFNKSHQKWRATISGKYIGDYSSEIEAALAYNKEALKLFGEFACLNSFLNKAGQ